jgi:hypothetical protein
VAAPVVGTLRAVEALAESIEDRESAAVRVGFSLDLMLREQREGEGDACGCAVAVRSGWRPSRVEPAVLGSVKHFEAVPPGLGVLLRQPPASKDAAANSAYVQISTAEEPDSELVRTAVVIDITVSTAV